MKDNRKVLYGLVALALLLSVVGISVGFASMSTELTINGTTEVVPATWKIKFQDLSAPTITGAAELTSEPTIQSDTHIGDYAIKLTKPGDSIVYTFKVANTGSINAALDSYTFATPTITGTGDKAVADAAIVQSNLVYTLTYEDGTPIQVNDTLNKETTRTLKLTVAYKQDATALPENTVSVSGMDVTFVYGQK